MPIFETIFLALLQGLTEFLPISSSAHLILPSQLLGFADQGLAFDVAVHAGSLLAVVLFFRVQVFELANAFFASFAGKKSKDSMLAWGIVIATIPAVIFGLLFGDFIEANLRSIWVIAGTTILFAPLLWVADNKRGESRNEYSANWKTAIAIGMAQALALIPGTSRSGITITAALMLGFTRQAAARYSFLMSIPVILAAGGYKTLELCQSPNQINWSDLGLGALFSFISAFACIHFFLKLIDKMGMLPFVIYRILLGLFLVGFGIYHW